MSDGGIEVLWRKHDQLAIRMSEQEKFTAVLDHRFKKTEQNIDSLSANISSIVSEFRVSQRGTDDKLEMLLAAFHEQQGVNKAFRWGIATLLTIIAVGTAVIGLAVGR